MPPAKRVVPSNDLHRRFRSDWAHPEVVAKRARIIPELYPPPIKPSSKAGQGNVFFSPPICHAILQNRWHQSQLIVTGVTHLGIVTRRCASQ